MRLVVSFVLLAACRQNAPSDPPRVTTTAQAEPAPASKKASARRHALELSGEARAILWDDAASRVVLTDDTHHRLVTWSRDRGFQPAGSLPEAEQVAGLVRLADGRFVATSFGFGSDGAVFVVDDRGAARRVPGLDPKRRRLGIAAGPDGALYVAFFVVAPGGVNTGGIARLDLETGETDLVTSGLGKPVGVVATETTLYVADEHHDRIVAYTLPDPGAPRVVAKDLAGADLLTRLPNGDLVTGGRRGTISRVSPDGRVTQIADGYERVRGTAYDPVGGRLFVVEHSAAGGRHKLHILSLDAR